MKGSRFFPSSQLDLIPVSERERFRQEMVLETFAKSRTLAWLGVGLLVGTIIVIDLMNVLAIPAAMRPGIFTFHVVSTILFAAFALTARRLAVHRAADVRPVHARFIALQAVWFVVFFNIVAVVAFASTGETSIYPLGAFLFVVMYFISDWRATTMYLVNFAGYLTMLLVVNQPTGFKATGAVSAACATIVAWVVAREMFRGRVGEFLNRAIVERQARELEAKNRELGSTIVELDDKISEVRRVNEELVASQKRADRIFSALAEALPGTVLDGKYRLDEKIGAGGFGAVYRGTHLTLDRPIAVKVFRPIPGNDSPEAAERFRLEGVSASRIAHPNAVTVLDSGISTEGIAYLVMELLIGHSLRDELRHVGKLPLRRAIGMLAPVCEVLAEAHRIGIIHRDIKPDNVFLHRAEAGETVKVVDFGIVKLMEGPADDNHLTATGNVVGTPIYMAPERFEAKPYDGTADVYSVGVMFFQMVCGRVPFDIGSSGVLGVMMQHLHSAPPSPRSFDPTLPPAVEALILRTLAKHPADRPTARELTAHLRLLETELPADQSGDQSGTGAPAILQSDIETLVVGSPARTVDGEATTVIHRSPDTGETV